MTQLIYHLFNKKGGGFKTHVTISVELFVIIVHRFQAVAFVSKSYLVDEAGFMHPFSEKNIVKTRDGT